MKILIVPETIAPCMAKHLTKKDAWDEYEMIIVKDEDYDEAMAVVAERLPDDKRLRILEVLHEAD